MRLISQTTLSGNAKQRRAVKRRLARQGFVIWHIGGAGCVALYVKETAAQQRAGE